VAARREPRISRPSLARAARAHGWTINPSAASLSLGDWEMMAEVRISHAASNRGRRRARKIGRQRGAIPALKLATGAGAATYLPETAGRGKFAFQAQ
jgi:hypothetical protein